MSATEPAGERPERKRRWRRRLVWLLAVAAALALAVRLVLPAALERGIPYALQRYVGVPAEIHNVDFWLLKGGVAFEGVVVGKAPAGGPEAAEPASLVSAFLHPASVDPASALVHWDRVFARIDWRALLSHEVRIRELSIDAPSVLLDREVDGRIDPLRNTKLAKPQPAEPAASAPAEPAANAPAEPKAQKPEKPWRYAVDRLALRSPEIKVADAPTGASLLEFGLEEFSLGDVHVSGDDIALGALGIKGPKLRVRREFVMGGPARPAPQKQPPERPAAASPAPGYRVQRIDVERAAFTLISDRGPLDVTLALHAEGVSARQDELFPIDLELGVAKGKLRLVGKLGVLPPAYEGKLTWEGLPFPLLLLGAMPQLAPWLRSSRGSGDLTVSARLAGATPGVRLSGRAGVDGFELADPGGKEVEVAWKSLDVGIREVFAPIPVEGAPPAPMRIALESVKLVEPNLRYTRPSPALEQLLGGPAKAQDATAAAKPAEPAEASTAKPAESKQPLDFSLGALEIAGGTLGFEDCTLDPPYRGGVDKLSVAARDVTFPSLAARDVRVRGVAPAGGSFQVTGSLAGGSGEFAIQLDKLALPPFNPYATGAAGYSLGGAASLKSKIRIRGARYDTNNRITLHELAVTTQKAGDFEGRFGIPIDLALALLRDPSGNISLTVPVVYDEKRVSTGIGTIVAGALRQALVGAITSPLKMIGAVLPGGGQGGGAPSLEPLGCVAGGDALAAGQEERLAGLAQLLASRPALKLALHGRTGPVDRPLVAEQLLVERAGQGEALPDLEGAGFFARRRLFAALERRSRGESAELSADDQALLVRYVEAQPVSPERMAQLARQRAERVRQLLVSQKGVEASRLDVASAADAGDPGVIVGFAAR